MNLSIPEEYKDPRYEYRWIRDDPSSIRRRTVQDDYDVVDEKQIAEDMRQAGVGLLPQRHGGTQDGKNYGMVLVRKPKDLYDEDQAEKQEMIDETEGGIRQGVVQSQDGLKGPTAYTPKEGISLRHHGGRSQ